MPDAPRWLDRDACAAYVSVRVDELPRLVKRGLLPAPIYHLGPRCPRWDRLALDARFTGGAASKPKGASGLAQAILEEAGR
jgi:hypothetical protein